MSIFEKFLPMEDEKVNIKSLLIGMIIVYLFSIAVRMIWVYQVSDNANFFWNDQIMINTNDGYFFAEGARDILQGFHQNNDLSPIDFPLSKLTAWIVKLFPFSIETVILYMPAIFGALLAIPIFLMGLVFRSYILGFVSALLGGIAWSYYNRTMTGYYDTDLLIVVLPSFMVWSLLLTLKSQKYVFLPLAPILTIVAMSWHGGVNNIANATLLMTLFYTLIFERRNLFFYKFLALYILSLVTLPLLVKFMLIIILGTIFAFFKNRLPEKIVIALIGLSVVIYMFFGGADWLIGILKSGYLLRAEDTTGNISLQFFNVVNTVREAGHIPFETFANRISGHTIVFFMSVLGYLLFILRHKLFLLTLPMVVLGFFALQGGLRFTVFAVPFMALGFGFLTLLFSKFISYSVPKKFSILSKYILVLLSTSAILYPNLVHIIGYRVPTVFMKDEVTVLDKLGKIAAREDYVVSWWDFGYPIRYYSDVKTLVDGGKHSGESNFPVSFALMKDQIASANMARLDVEFTEKAYQEKKSINSFRLAMSEYNINNPGAFLSDLSKKTFKHKYKSRDIYYYLPNRMLQIFPTVDLFSNMDITTGKQFPRGFFYSTQNFSNSQNGINLNNGVSITKDGHLQIGSNKVPMKDFYTTFYDNSGKLNVQRQLVNNSSNFSVVFMKNYNTFLVLDQRMVNSTFIQLFVFEQYDKELFEPVILTPLAKVYKLKI